MKYSQRLITAVTLSVASIAHAQNLKVIEVAKKWLAANTYDPTSKVYLLAGHKNPYLSTAEKPVYYWDYWCAGFVGQIAWEANGKPDPQFTAAAPSLDVPPTVVPYNRDRDTSDKIGAKVAYSLMVKAGRVHEDFKNILAGAAVFWTGGLPYGHVAIFSGDRDETGDLLMITTGWPSRPGTRLRSLKSLNEDLGSPVAWVDL